MCAAIRNISMMTVGLSGNKSVKGDEQVSILLVSSIILSAQGDASRCSWNITIVRSLLNANLLKAQ
jgi:hypothetical protein